MNRIEKAKKIMRIMHKGIVHESGSMVTDKIQGIVDKIEKFYDGEDKEDVIVAAYMQDALNKKYIRPRLLERDNRFPFTFDSLKRLFGNNVARMVFELSTEPNDRLMNKSLSPATTMDLAKKRLENCDPTAKKPMSEQEFTARAIALWSSDLSQGAQVILLARKMQEFEEAKDKIDMRRSLSWHKDCNESSMLIVEALADSCPSMYAECIKTNAAVSRNIDALERSIVSERRKLQDGLCI